VFEQLSLTCSMASRPEPQIAERPSIGSGAEQAVPDLPRDYDRNVVTLLCMIPKVSFVFV
jgi:hypothetical protein